MTSSLALPLLLLVLSCLTPAIASSDARCFPPDFLLGATPTISRERSNWSDFCQPGVECSEEVNDSFRRYSEVAQRTSDLGLSSFRFSISWSRLMLWDATQRKMRPNPQGIASYHQLLDDLQTKGLQAVVTLYDSDLPAVLHSQLEPKGWLNREIVTHFEAFAELAFREYGDKVKYWATFDEPLTFTSGGYGLRDAALGDMQLSNTDMYTVAHNVLLSHARAVKVFRVLKRENVVDAKARVGIVLNAAFGYAVDESNALDVAAVERKMQFDLGWFLMPLVTGDYPEIMRERAGERLQRFTTEQAALVKGSYDLLMLSRYDTRVVTDCDSERSEISCEDLPLGLARDRGIDDTRALNGARALPAHSLECSWLAGNSDGYLATIKWLHAKDPSAEILLMESGACGDNQVDSREQLRYFQTVVDQVHKVPIIGYMAHIPQVAAKWFAHLSTTKCLDDWNLETIAMDTEEEAETRQKLHYPEAGGNDAGVPWSLREVIFLVVVGVLILGAITCEAMRELRLSSQGSPDELQLLITVED